MNKLIEILLGLIEDLGPKPIRIKIPVEQTKPWEKR